MNEAKKSISPGIAFADRQKESACVLSEVTGKVYQVLNDCTNTLAINDSFRRCFALMNSLRPKHTEYIVRNDRQFDDKFIGIKLA